MVFSPDLGAKNGGVLSMRMQVILDSSFARPGSAPIGGGQKGEFRDWTRLKHAHSFDRCGLKQWIVLNARVDWLVKLRISCAIYLRANREKWRRGLHR